MLWEAYSTSCCKCTFTEKYGSGSSQGKVSLLTCYRPKCRESIPSHSLPRTYRTPADEFMHTISGAVGSRADRRNDSWFILLIGRPLSSRCCYWNAVAICTIRRRRSARLLTLDVLRRLVLVIKVSIVSVTSLGPWESPRQDSLLASIRTSKFASVTVRFLPLASAFFLPFFFFVGLVSPGSKTSSGRS